MRNTVSVFVSSTYYDLRQVRADLQAFIETMGFHPYVSEQDSFPVDPSLSTIENCKRNVQQADIYVLIVGGRYGYVDSSTDRSVTNLEYLEAKARGIPVYVFVESKVLNVLDVWRANKTADLSSVVQTPRVLEFVDELRTPRAWVYSFETAQDIVRTLKQQWAYLFADALTSWQRERRPDVPAIVRGFEGRARMLALAKPDFWEYLLFAEVVSERVAGLEALRLDLKHGIDPARARKLGPRQLAEDLSVDFGEIVATIDVIEPLMKTAAAEAFGPPGVAGNPAEIVHVANRLADVYQKLLDRAAKWRHTASEEPRFAPVIDRVLGILDSVLEQLHSYIGSLRSQIEGAVRAAAQVAPGGEVPVLDLTLRLDLPESSVEGFHAALDRSLVDWRADRLLDLLRSEQSPNGMLEHNIYELAQNLAWHPTEVNAVFDVLAGRGDIRLFTRRDDAIVFRLDARPVPRQAAAGGADDAGEWQIPRVNRDRGRATTKTAAPSAESSAAGAGVVPLLGDDLLILLREYMAEASNQRIDMQAAADRFGVTLDDVRRAIRQIEAKGGFSVREMGPQYVSYAWSIRNVDPF